MRGGHREEIRGARRIIVSVIETILKAFYMVADGITYTMDAEWNGREKNTLRYTRELYVRYKRT